MGERGSAAVCNLERGVKIAVERAAREGNGGRMVVGGINRGGDIMSGFDHPPAGTQAGRAACTRKKFFQLCRKEKPREFNLIRSWVSYTGMH